MNLSNLIHVEMTPLKYRGVLLDFYGTLVSEDDSVVAEICEEIAVTASTTTTAKEIATFWWKTFSRSIQESNGASFRSQRTIALDSLSETIRSFGSTLSAKETIERQYAQWVAPAILPDARRFLDNLEKMAIPCCIVSNIDRSDLELALDFHNLKLDHIITSDEVRSYKPNQAIFQRALDILELQPPHVLHIGDSRTSDVAGAIRAGIPVAWINRTSKVVLTAPLPTYSVQSLDELQAALRGI